MTNHDVSQEAVEALADQWEHRSYEVSSMLRALSRANEELRGDLSVAGLQIAAARKEAQQMRERLKDAEEWVLPTTALMNMVVERDALRERAELADRMYAETNSALMRSGRVMGEKAADVILLTERVEKYKNALRTIKQWDCLNPPRADLLGDLPWLRGIVDAALASQGAKGPGYMGDINGPGCDPDTR